MTARLTRAEIVRRFVAGESVERIADDLFRSGRVDDWSGRSMASVESALRAALRAARKTKTRTLGTTWMIACAAHDNAHELCSIRFGSREMAVGAFMATTSYQRWFKIKGCCWAIVEAPRSTPRTRKKAGIK